MEEKTDGGPDYMQMREAYNYVTEYIKFIGGDPVLDYPESEKDIPRGWAESAKKAWKVVDDFDKENEGVEF